MGSGQLQAPSRQNLPAAGRPPSPLRAAQRWAAGKLRLTSSSSLLPSSGLPWQLRLGLASLWAQQQQQQPPPGQVLSMLGIPIAIPRCAL